METASNVICDALKEIVATPGQVPIGSYEANVGIFYLNTMMAGLSTIGVNVGFTYVKSLGDDITVPDSALEPIVKNLAIEMSPIFSESLTSQDLFEQAEDGINVLRTISIRRPANAGYPSTLPIGSGNYDTFCINDYYNAFGKDILTEISGNIGPETADA
jgi:hypothetical protein